MNLRLLVSHLSVAYEVANAIRRSAEHMSDHHEHADEVVHALVSMTERLAELLRLVESQSLDLLHDTAGAIQRASTEGVEAALAHDTNIAWLAARAKLGIAQLGGSARLAESARRHAEAQLRRARAADAQQVLIGRLQAAASARATRLTRAPRQDGDYLAAALQFSKRGIAFIISVALASGLAAADGLADEHPTESRVVVAIDAMLDSLSEVREEDDVDDTLNRAREANRRKGSTDYLATDWQY